MAKNQRNLVVASSINIEKGLMKDVQLLERYIGQQPDDAVEILERCIETGSKKMREAAFPLLARIDLDRAEARALEQADIGARAKKPKQRAERFAFLVEVATPRCLDRAEALGVELGTLYAHQLARAVEWLQRRLVRERERGTSAEWLLPIAGMFAYEEEANPACEWIASLLEAPDTSDVEREAVFAGLIESRYLPACRRADLPDQLVAKAAFAMPSRECFDRLTPVFDRLPANAALNDFAGANMMWEPADDRWLDYWQRRFADADSTEKLRALRALKDAARVETETPLHARIDAAIIEHLANLPWDDRTADFLRSASVWKHPAAADIQLKGVAHASQTYNDRGHRVLAGMLWAMRDHGRAEHLPELEALARHVASITGGSQAAEAWFRDAIGAIRGRG
jgi:hypothetical protein